jgi:hypothetical protein
VDRAYVRQNVLRCNCYIVSCGQGWSLVFSTLVNVADCQRHCSGYRTPAAGRPSQSVNELKNNVSEAGADVIACGKTLNTLAMLAQSRLSLGGRVGVWRQNSTHY